MCFTQNTCCCCKMPLWVGTLFIGLFEFGVGHDMTMMGFTWGGMYMFNSIWFALLFIPSLFYSPTYRKAVLIVFTITTILNIVSMIWQTVMSFMLTETEWDALKVHYGATGGSCWSNPNFTGTPATETIPEVTIPDVDVSADIGGGIGGGMGGGIGGGFGGDMGVDMGGDMGGDMDYDMPAGGHGGMEMDKTMWKGDKAATTDVWRYLYNNGMMQDWNREEETYTCDQWNARRWDMAYMDFFMQLWFGLVFVRIFYNIVLMKWCNEAAWIKTVSSEESKDSHPCRPVVCCQGCMM